MSVRLQGNFCQPIQQPVAPHHAKQTQHQRIRQRRNWNSWYNGDVSRRAEQAGVRLGNWIAATEGIIVADVIRWTEGIYEKRRRKKDESRRIGERQVTAEVLEVTDDGWLKLLVRACVVTQDDYAGSRLPMLNAGVEIKRARKTVQRGKTERLLWSDETARKEVDATKRHSN